MLLAGLAIRRSAEDIIATDMRRLADSVRLNTVKSWPAFRDAWDEVTNGVRQSMARPGLSEHESAQLLELLRHLQEKRMRMDTLSSVPVGKLPWAATRKFIMGVNEWNEFGTQSNSQYRKDAKDLQMLFALHKHDQSDVTGDDGFGASGLFGGSRGGGKAKVCFHCKEEGHVSRHCPKRNKDKGNKRPRGGKDERTCYFCDKVGHVVADCPEKKKRKSSSEGEDDA